MEIAIPKSILALRSVTNPRFSPSGKYLGYTIKSFSDNLNQYASNLIVLDLITNERWEIFLSDASFQYFWSEDDELFISNSLSKNETQIKKWIPGRGMEPGIEIPLSFSESIVLENGALLVKAAEPCEKQPDLPFEIEEYPYTCDGKGWICGKNEGLYIYNFSDKSIAHASPSDFKIQLYYTWDNKIALVGWYQQETDLEKPGLYCWDISTGNCEEWIAPGQFYIRQIFALDHNLYFAGSDGQHFGRYEYTGFFQVHSQDKSATLFAPYEGNVGLNSVLNDIFPDSGKKLCVSENVLYFITSIHHKSGVKRLALDGTVSDFLTHSLTVESLDVSNGRIAYCGNREMRTAELYLAQDETDLNLAEVPQPQLKWGLSKPEPITFNDLEGVSVYGWVLKPHMFSDKKKYPAVLSIHGGPRSAYGPIYSHELQCLAAQGYFVLFCNPRGSDTYGNRFGQINGLYGTIDMQNLLQMLDESIPKYPQIDITRVGVNGGSYGGFMVNWLVGHCDRFSAAVSQRGISNWVSQEALSDIGKEYVKDQMGCSILECEDMDRLWESSPLRYAHNIRTPMLFLHSDADMRCPLEEARQMFYILRGKGIPARMVVFRGESHNLSRSGKPINRIRRIEEILRWFKQYL